MHRCWQHHTALAARLRLWPLLHSLLLLLLCHSAPSSARKPKPPVPDSGAAGSCGADPSATAQGSCSAADAAADYVIVGGGTAGSVLAARLCAALPNRTFTLLERGAPRSPDSELRVRAMRHAFTAWQDPALTQELQSQPNPALAGREVTVLAAHTLGGGSAIGRGQWTKPPLHTFDAGAWAFDGLSSAKAAQLFERAEQQLAVAAPAPELSQTHLHPYLQAAAAAGFAVSPHPPRPDATPAHPAVWPSVVTADAAGRRRDAYTAYAAPAAAGPCAHNLRVVQSAVAARIVIADGRAVAVEYVKTDAPPPRRTWRAEARVGVLLSAGPYGSPQLLQLSGIGPGGLLRIHGIEVLRDLPVGLNSISQPSVSLVDAYTTDFAPENDGAIINAPETLAQFRAGRGGAYGIPVTATSAVLPAERSHAHSSNTSPGPLRGMPLIASACAVIPTARGGVAIAGRGPLMPPFVHTNLLGNPEDARHAVACLQRLRQVTQQLQPTLGLMSVVPGAGAGVDGGLVAETADSSHHTVGGCEVGAVVGGDFGVMGVAGLRVVDASVLPDMPPFAGPLATVYMIAELAAERVLQDEQRSNERA